MLNIHMLTKNVPQIEKYRFEGHEIRFNRPPVRLAITYPVIITLVALVDNSTKFCVHFCLNVMSFRAKNVPQVRIICDRFIHTHLFLQLNVVQAASKWLAKTRLENGDISILHECARSETRNNSLTWTRRNQSLTGTKPS